MGGFSTFGSIEIAMLTVPPDLPAVEPVEPAQAAASAVSDGPATPVPPAAARRRSSALRVSPAPFPISPSPHSQPSDTGILPSRLVAHRGGYPVADHGGRQSRRAWSPTAAAQS